MSIIKKIDPSDIFNGCLYYLKDRISFKKEDSSTFSGNIEDIVKNKGTHNSLVCNDNIGFTNITIDLNKKYVLPTSYSLMGET